MAKLKWSRPNNGYEVLGQNIPPMPKPLTEQARKAWKTLRRNMAARQELVNQTSEQRHAQHQAHAVTIHGRHHLWCRECQQSITELTEQEYREYLKIFPPQVRRVKKQT